MRDLRMQWSPGRQHKGINYVYIIIHLVYIIYVSNDPQLSTIEEGLKNFSKETGEKPLRGVGKRVRVRAYIPYHN
jgi:hypothetical protein